MSQIQTTHHREQVDLAQRSGHHLRWLLLLVVGMIICWPLLWTSRENPNPLRRKGLRGVSLGLFASQPEYDYGTMLREIKLLGAKHVLISLSWYLKDKSSHRVAPLPGRTPSSMTLRRTLRQARRMGLEVALMPIVRLQYRQPDEWRGQLNPVGGPLLWFRSYGRLMEELATLAAEEGVTRLAIGSELASMESYAPSWRALIKRIRRRFRGQVFYSLNWDRVSHPLPFVDALDEVGVTAYLPMRQHGSALSRRTVMRRWSRFFQSLAQAQTRWQRPVFLSEVGYPALSSAALAPWDHTRKAGLDTQLQARLWRLFCHAFDTQRASASPATHRPHKASITGFYAWNWFGVGGPRDPGYSVRGKPASRALAQCL